jgi:hypothetical protein
MWSNERTENAPITAKHLIQLARRQIATLFGVQPVFRHEPHSVQKLSTSFPQDIKSYRQGHAKITPV